MPVIELNHYVSFSTYTWHDKRALPAAMLSTKRETLIIVMATRRHLIDNMVSIVIELLSATSADDTCNTLWCDTEQKKRLLLSSRPASPLHFCALSKGGFGL